MKNRKENPTVFKNLTSKVIFTLAICLMSLSLSNAQNLGLVKDVNPTALSSAGVSGFIPFNSQTIFSADDGTHGTELWITNGTEIGTALLKDINTTSFGPNNNSGIFNFQLAVLNNQFFFGGYDGINGTELWVSDGTTNGTFMLKDIVSGASGSDAQAFITFQNKVYFVAKDAFGFNSLWTTDGTAIGTVNIKDNIDIQVQPNGTIGSILNGKLYFKAFDVLHGSELWTSDGTTIGTELVKDIFSGTGSGMGNKITVCNGLLYFFAKDNNITGNELWKSDGTSAGTLMIKDIGPTPVSSVPYNFTAMNGLTYFAANDGPNFESNLYVTDGTTGGTQKVKQINTTSNGSAIGEIIAYDNKIYFSAFDGVNGSELWVSDGTAIGTQLFADINPGAGFSSPQNLMIFNQKLLFMAASNGNNNALYETDHNANNMHIISSNPEPTPVFSPENSLSNGVLYFNCKTSGTDDAVYRYPAQEPVIIWTGNVSTNWFNINNWSPNQIPSQNDDIQLPGGKPRYPLITTNTAKCREMEIQAGATLTMTGGILNVYGEITATDANMFDLTGGTLKLFFGSIFPENMNFFNLIITNVNDVVADNIYEFPGIVQINGNLTLNGTATSDLLPDISLAQDNHIFLFKNLTVNKGRIGIDFSLLPLSNNNSIPRIIFSGTNVQNIQIKNFDPGFEQPNIWCNLYIQNPNVKIVNSPDDILFYNLVLQNNLNLGGGRITLLGKIVYQGSNLKIANSKPNFGSITILGQSDFVYDMLPHDIRIDKLGKLSFNPDRFPTANENIILKKALVTDTLVVGGNLDLFGRNVTIGATTSNKGFVDVDTMFTTPPQGTLTLLGNNLTPRYKLNAQTLNNLTVNAPSGVELNNITAFDISSPSYGRMELWGTIKLEAGNFDLKGSRIFLAQTELNNTTINLGSIIETPGNTFTNSNNNPGQDFFIVKDTLVSTVCSDMNVGGLGFFVTCSNPLNEFTILRIPTNVSGLNGGSSINRVFGISNPNAGSNLNAQIKLKYDDSELQGINESNLIIFRHSDNEPNGVWNIIPSTVNTTSNTVTANAGLSQIDYSTSGPSGVTFYTLASITSPLRNEESITNQSETNTTKVKVYPNPFNNKLNAQFHSEVAEAATLQLIDLTGKQMHIEDVQLVAGSNDISLCCIEKLPAGIYFLRITSSKTNSIVKVVKD